jgi:hypothetical protein
VPAPCCLENKRRNMDTTAGTLIFAGSTHKPRIMPRPAFGGWSIRGIPDEVCHIGIALAESDATVVFGLYT